MKENMAENKTIETYMKNDERLAQAILEAFSKLYIYDKHLIINKPNDDNESIGFHHVGERSIVFRFAFYLQEILSSNKIYSDYNLDCEYNRNGTKPKRISALGRNVYPDLIIHQRGNNDNNLLVMEFKTYWNRKQKDDIKKIKAFISDSTEEGYNYKYGIAVLINQNSINLKMFDKQETRFTYNVQFP